MKSSKSLPVDRIIGMAGLGITIVALLVAVGFLMARWSYVVNL